MSNDTFGANANVDATWLSREISNYDDVIDSRDVIERIRELESERDDVMSDGEHSLIVEWHDEHGDELDELKAFAAQGDDCIADWEFGEALIRDSYFETYAMKFANDIGAIDANATWPLTCIDWEQAARELRVDYSAVEFGGVTYWAR